MKKQQRKIFITVLGAALSLSLLAGCGATPQSGSSRESGVVKAFYAVAPASDLVSQTAAADGENYRVTVVTSSSVSEYTVNSAFEVEGTTVVGSAVPTALSEGAGVSSDLERAYERALELSGIDRADVVGFDFDKGSFMGKAVLKVEIEDAVAEYSYTFDADGLTLLASKTELKNTATPKEESSYIGEARATEIALGALGIDGSAAKDFTLKSAMENGRRYYKASFEYEGSRYTVEIDAVSGEIVEFSRNVLDESATLPALPALISEEEAKQIAISFAFPDGAGNTSITFLKVKLDYEKGSFVYEVEFIAAGSEYEFEISAVDGAVLDVEIDSSGKTGNVPQGETFITREEAIAKVLERVGTDAFVIEVDIDKEYRNGEMRYFYEIEVKVNGREQEYYVDAVTGEVTLNEGYAGNPVNPNPAITEEQAVQIALDTFGLDPSQITRQTVKLELENGVLCYEIKFYVDKAEYKVCISAQTGDILEKEIDREHETEPTTPSTGNYLTREQARAAVTEYFSQRGKTAKIKEIEWEDEGYGENRRYYYEVEAVVDGREYECYVDASTGEVRIKGELIDSAKDLIGEERALSIALDYYSLTKAEARVIKVKLEEDDGILIYEVEFKVRDLEYSFEIDAETGDILDIDVSFD